MTSKTQQLTDLLKGAYHLGGSNEGLAAYHAAKAMLNGNRMATTQRRYSAVKTAANPFRVMVSLDTETSNIRIFRPDTKSEFVLAV